jgi:hypothetical protein
METAHALVRIPMLLLAFLGIAGGILDIADMLHLPISALVVIALAFLLLALDRELRVWTLAWQLDARSDLQQRIDILARFRDEVINLLYAGTPTRAEFEIWKSNFHAWEDSLVQYLEVDFPFAVYEMFKDQGLIPEETFLHLSKDRSIRKKHLSCLRRIAKHLQVLETLIQHNTSITKQREPSFAEALGHAGFGA